MSEELKPKRKLGDTVFTIANIGFYRNRVIGPSKIIGINTFENESYTKRFYELEGHDTATGKATRVTGGSAVDGDVVFSTHEEGEEWIKKFGL